VVLIIRRRRDESFSGHYHRADIFPDGSAGAAVGYLANPVLNKGRDAQRFAGQSLYSGGADCGHHYFADYLD
jgi:hypothetical protein